MPGMHFKGGAKGGKKLGGGKPSVASRKGLSGTQMKTPIGRKIGKR